MSAETVLGMILAAGYSRRFGEDDKRCCRLPDGRTLLESTVAQANEAFPLLRVVVREEDDIRVLGLSGTTPILRVRHAESGLGASLGEAITHLEQDESLQHVSAVAILLGDMPCIRSETLRAMQREAGRSHIIRPSYAGRPGHPVIMGRDFWPELASLRGDEGGKHVIRRHQNQYHEVPVDDAGIHIDVDSLKDLQDID
ncbi:nucleotidyltransferase family protein [Halomonas huangheensis]|uniref:MobA-like NTP transferase domain-containing protein n=1 Tax=Halomonas huangheensis TaxID=1178482 RepID=W1N3B6_9GAMM|nr:nucleotidyltransferase family protein [Halomonas huangheensis]ALM52228.1 hypothetical protein AR456_07970 [Halomonas huangheensis]ERL49450.1 hypothetical protein BJB45_06630 [Halomonas huangheensis]